MRDLVAYKISRRLETKGGRIESPGSRTKSNNNLLIMITFRLWATAMANCGVMYQIFSLDTWFCKGNQEQLPTPLILKRKTYNSIWRDKSTNKICTWSANIINITGQFYWGIGAFRWTMEIFNFWEWLKMCTFYIICKR